jgi:hypothetical protein
MTVLLDHNIFCSSFGVIFGCLFALVVCSYFPMGASIAGTRLPKRLMATIQCGPSVFYLNRKPQLRVCDPERPIVVAERGFP